MREQKCFQRDQQYLTDLNDAEWEQIQTAVPQPKPGGRPAKHSRRDILNGIRYVVRGGGAWHLLPHDFAPWKTVYHYFRLWAIQGVWQALHDRLREAVRRAAGRKPTPTAAVLDSQSVKTADQGGERGYDAGKQVNGRKRHVLVDTLGLLLGVVVTGAQVTDTDGAVELLADRFMDFFRLAVIWADSIYRGRFVQWVKSLRPFGRLHLEIVSGLAGQKGFQVQPKRWIVERTFGWLFKFRRLRVDYEKNTRHSEAMIQLAMISIMLKRLA
jgi:putative transposase